MKELVELPLRNLSRRPERSFITLLGVIIGVTAIVSLTAMGEGLKVGIMEQFQRIGPDVLVITPGSVSAFSSFSSCVLTDDDAERVEGVRGVEEVAGTCYRSGMFCRGNDCTVALVTLSSNMGIFEESGLPLAEGRNPERGERNKIAVGSSFGEDLFGRKLGAGDRIKLEGDAVEIVGVYERTGDPQDDRVAVMDLKGGREFFGTDDETLGNIVATVSGSYEPEEVAERVEKELERNRNEEFSVQTSTELLEIFDSILGGVSWVFLGIASISIVVGGVGITNTMYMSIMERTQEIGLMKAIGATNRRVEELIVVESGLLGLLGGFAGVLIGWVVAVLATDIARARLGSDLFIARISPELVLFALAFSFCIGVASGWLPAREAAGLEPVEALRYE